ncbi:hypothetical protein [Paenibacillus silvisoli]|uniref:hypothetical protein n=1 Tax=Paenibacillus silvisoli TaxID=3110539 RepID=UPI002805988C|nr:hypothetical protein [Paenibacillus silvisoli]
MFKKSVALLISLLLSISAGMAVRAQTGSAAAQATPPVLIALDEQLQDGHFALTFNKGVSLKDLQANFAIPNKKITWYTEKYAGTNKSYYGIIQNAVKGLAYPVKLGKGITLGKNAEANLLWRKDYINGNLGFYLDIGKFMITTTIKTNLEVLKKNIKAGGASVLVEPASENDGLNWIVTIPNAKPNVNYDISFTKPIVISNTQYSWKQIPVQLTGAILDFQSGSIELAMDMEAERELSIQDLVITATLNDQPYKLQHVSYKGDGILSFSPIPDLGTDVLKITIAGKVSADVTGIVNVSNAS